MPVTVLIEHEHLGDDLDAVRRRLGDSGHVRRAMGDLLDESARLGAESARLHAPRRSDALERAISSEHATLQPSGSLEAVVGVAPVEGRSYPLYVHEGTGLFGHFRRRISPRRSRAMRFVGRTGVVYARSVAGQRPRPYLAEAFEDVKLYADQRIDSMVRRILETDA